MSKKSAQWIKNNARLHQMATQIAGAGMGAHEILQTMASEMYNIESLGALSESQQVKLMTALQPKIDAAQGLLDIAKKTLTNGQKLAIKTAAKRGCNWSAERLHEDMDKVFGHHTLSALTSDEANKYIQRLNLIKKNTHHGTEGV